MKNLTPLALTIAALALSACDREPAAPPAPETTEVAAAPAPGVTNAPTAVPNGAPAMNRPGPQAPLTPEAMEARRSEMLAKRQERQEERRQRREWWTNNELVAKIGLNAGQAEAIGQRYAALETEALQAATKSQEAGQQFRVALAAGDLDAARQAAREQAEASAAQQLAGQLAQIDVAAILSAEQRQSLLTENRGALASFARGGAGGAGRGMREIGEMGEGRMGDKMGDINKDRDARRAERQARRGTERNGATPKN